LNKWLGLVGGLLMATVGMAQIDTSRTVVVINGEEIKGGEYYHRMEYLSGVGKPMNGGVAEFPPGFLTIEQLITERLVLQLAKAKGVLPTDPEVQNEIKIRLEDNPKLLEDWLNSGRTQDELNYTIRLELAQFKISTAGINVTDQEIEQHYKENPRMYTTSKQMKLSVIVVRDDATKAKVDADLKAGKTFSETAKAYSEDVTKGLGGELGTLNYAVLSQTVRASLEGTKIGQTTDWLVTADARIKFLLQDIVAEKKLPLDARLKREIRKRLMMDKGAIKNNVQKEMFDLRSKANIDIKDKAFSEAYNRYIEAYKKDQSIKTAGSGGR
jgi:parvulin-like peptidyl-prolyl isomerase